LQGIQKLKQWQLLETHLYIPHFPLMGLEIKAYWNYIKLILLDIISLAIDHSNCVPKIKCTRLFSITSRNKKIHTCLFHSCYCHCCLTPMTSCCCVTHAIACGAPMSKWIVTSPNKWIVASASERACKSLCPLSTQFF
jgi:hypothetical protein